MSEIDPRFAKAHYEHDLKVDPLLRAMRDDGLIATPQAAVAASSQSAELMMLADEPISGFVCGQCGTLLAKGYDCGACGSFEAVTPQEWESGQRDTLSEEAHPVLKADKYDYALLPFLTLMQKELHANSSKGDRPGWLQMSRQTGMLEIYYHTAKLQKAVRDDDTPSIKEYAADVANLCMMILDICGGLEFVEQAAQADVVAVRDADDAKRYRHLRSAGNETKHYVGDGGHLLSGEKLDTAIDADME